MFGLETEIDAEHPYLRFRVGAHGEFRTVGDIIRFGPQVRYGSVESQSAYHEFAGETFGEGISQGQSTESNVVGALHGHSRIVDRDVGIGGFWEGIGRILFGPIVNLNAIEFAL